MTDTTISTAVKGPRTQLCLKEKEHSDSPINSIGLVRKFVSITSYRKT